MSETLILPNQPDRICIINGKGEEVEINSADMWMYEPDAFRSTGEEVRIITLDELPREEWMKQGEDDA